LINFLDEIDDQPPQSEVPDPHKCFGERERNVPVAVEIGRQASIASGD
jgi:hypothetical protein